MVNPNIHENIKPILQEVFNYSQNGQYTQHLDFHIESNQENISEWVDQMNIYN